jgi:FKBP-type peptidyl-prolyl cis-trans isomerase
LPQSRHRRTKARKRPKGTGPRPGGANPQTQNNSQVKAIAIVVVAALLLSGAVYLLFFQGRGGGKEVTLPDGLKYVDTVEGTGPTPQRGQTLSVQYTGTLENGTKFDSSYDHGAPMNFKLGVDPMIKGWDEGVATMKVGGKRRIIVPAALGYGATGRPNIPPNSKLIFEIELLSAK